MAGVSASCCYLQVGHAVHFADGVADGRGGLVDGLEVLAEDIDHFGRSLARQALAEAVAKEGHHFHVDAGITREDLAQLVLNVSLVGGGVALEFDVEFRLRSVPKMSSPPSGPPKLLLHGRYRRQRQDLAADAPSWTDSMSSRDVPGTALLTWTTNAPSRKSGMNWPWKEEQPGDGAREQHHEAGDRQLENAGLALAMARAWPSLEPG